LGLPVVLGVLFEVIDQLAVAGNRLLFVGTTRSCEMSYVTFSKVKLHGITLSPNLHKTVRKARIKITRDNSLDRRHLRIFPLALAALLTVAIGFNPAAHAQDASAISNAPGPAPSIANNSTQEGNTMEAIGLLVTLEARPGKEADAEAFLKSAQPLALNENGTLKWYAIKLGPGRFGIFDTFANEGGRNAHLSGEIANALGARANELFATPPQIEKVEILATTPLKN
jgi:quinol monooxygenase YgiN